MNSADISVWALFKCVLQWSQVTFRSAILNKNGNYFQPKHQQNCSQNQIESKDNDELDVKKKKKTLEKDTFFFTRRHPLDIELRLIM